MIHKLLNNKKEIIVDGNTYRADKNGIVELPKEVTNQDCVPVNKDKEKDKGKDKEK